MLTGNEQIYYENKPVKIRFANAKKNVSTAGIKSIFKIFIVSFSGCLSFGFISSNKLLPSGDHGVSLKFSLFDILIYS